MLTLLLACHDPGEKTPTPEETGSPESVPIEHSGDSSDSGSGESGGDSGDSGGGDTEEQVVEGFSLALDADIVTMIYATWDDPAASDSWIEYRFETDEWQVAPAIEPGSGVILGIPGNTQVEARAAAVVDGVTIYSDSSKILTGKVPLDVLVPAISSYDPSLAYDANYIMTVVAVSDYTYMPPYYIEIFDRQGRIVWYKEVPDDMMTFYPTVSRDGTHMWYEAEDIFGMGTTDPYVTRQTLDGRWSYTLPVPALGEGIAEGPDGSYFFEYRSGGGHSLEQLAYDGSVTQIWDCAAWYKDHGQKNTEYCDMNTCNWDESRNTVLVSQFYADTVFEIDVSTGEPIRQMGQLQIGDPYTFDPSESMFDYQHDPYWTSAGTLLVSTHIKGTNGVQVAAEYTVDDSTKTLTRIWDYTSTDMWATQVGEAVRLPNGNTEQGYGQDGAIREVTPDGTVVWQALWDKDFSGYRSIGHAAFIPDLYALNVGPE